MFQHHKLIWIACLSISAAALVVSTWKPATPEEPYISKEVEKLVEKEIRKYAEQYEKGQKSAPTKPATTAEKLDMSKEVEKLVEKELRKYAEQYEKDQKGTATKIDLIEGSYHWAGKGCAIELIDRKKGWFRLHFPKGFPDFSEMILDGVYNPVIDRFDILRDGHAVATAFIGFHGEGPAVLVFSELDYWTKGCAR